MRRVGRGRGAGLRKLFMEVIGDTAESPGRASLLALQVVRGLLRIASWGYLAGVAVRKAFFQWGILRAHRLSVPVISVGNLTCGGTGKTPLVHWIARLLKKSGKRSAILSRGYGGMGHTSDESQAVIEEVEDVPHLLGVDRVKSGTRAIQEFGAECLILDDAFQHLRLERDLDIVTVDALNPFGGGYVLPRGLLREPIDALRRAHVVVLTRTDQCERKKVDALRAQVVKIKPSLLLAEAVHRPTVLIRWQDGERIALDFLFHKRILAFCGIGNPRAFALTLEGLGAQVAGRMDFPDHYRYRDADLTAIKSEAQRLGVQAAVTTRKDAVKISKNVDFGVPFFVLDIEMEITQGRDAFEQRIRETCGLA